MEPIGEGAVAPDIEIRRLKLADARDLAPLIAAISTSATTITQSRAPRAAEGLSLDGAIPLSS